MAKRFFVALLAFVSILHGSNAIAKIDPSLTQRFLFGGGGETQNVLVSFTGGIRSALDAINQLNISSLAKKRDALVTAQQTLADTVQAGLKGVLNFMGIPYESFWISNSMIVPNVDSRIVNIISRIPGVAKVEKEPVMKIDAIEEEEQYGDMARNRTRMQNESLQWGIEKIRAHLAWKDSNVTGKGVVVAGIGVRHTHYLLEKNWRSDYGWFDPFHKTSLPSDSNGHGTHTMGTIVGSDGYGVSPGAKWIACKGCVTGSCSAATLLACGQWVLCPTKPDGTRRKCNRAPDIVSNSWVGSDRSSWYDNVILAWKSAGIIPVFSQGNNGPLCGSVRSPEDNPNVISVGSIDPNGKISSSSSLGPTKHGRIKPDVVAPGRSIKSASHKTDTAITTMSGTSMACPHVSGTIALMMEKNPSLSFEMVYKVLTHHTIKSEKPTKTCGGVKKYNFPNNIFGYGQINAESAAALV